MMREEFDRWLLSPHVVNSSACMTIVELICLVLPGY